MGYTHYWRRPSQIDPTTFYYIMRDFKSIIVTLRATGVPLAGPDGTMSPIIRLGEIRFNGVRDCGHPPIDTGIGWPSDSASGVRRNNADVVVGGWFAGALLTSRACDGDCSHESFEFLREEPVGDYRDAENAQCFQFCKTAYKPYDLAVCCALVIAKHYLGNGLSVMSDGTIHHYRDAMSLVEQHLSYGNEFVLDDWK